MVFDFPYILCPTRTGDMKTDVVNLLTENRKEKVATHCVDVAETCARLTERFRLDPTVAYASGILHDVSGVVRPTDMLAYAEKMGWYIDASERKHPFILHQRMSAVAAREHFNVSDAKVLSAIECHTTLKAHASEYDMLLFLADKIAWDQPGTPPFFDEVQAALHQSLRNASLVYIRYVLEHHMILHPHQWLLEAKTWLEA